MSNETDLKKLVYRRWCGLSQFLIFGVLFIVGGIIVKPTLNSVIQQKVLDQVLLSKENSDTWGQFPGKYDILVERNITVFQLQNVQGSMLKGEKPIFKESIPLSFRESSDVKDLEYLEDKKFMKMKQTINTTEYNQDDAQKAIMESTIDIPNIGALGTWGAINNFNESKIAWGALAGMVSGVERDDSVHWGAISYAVSSLFLSTRELVENLFSSVENLTDTQKEQLYSDVNFGMKSFLTLPGWVKAVVQGLESDMAIILKNHFYLSWKQLSEIIRVLTSHVTAAEDTLGGRFGCPNNRCNATILTANQWATQAVTNGIHLEPIQKFKSIKFLNQTVFGYPEFGYWLSDKYLPSLTEDQQKKFDGVIMPVEVAERLIKISLTADERVTSEDALCHEYNQKLLWDWGRKYDEANDPEELNKIKTKFGIPSDELAILVWEYMKYLRFSWATFETDSPELAAKALIAAMSTEKVFQTWHDLTHLTIKSRMIAADMISDKYSCENFVNNSFFSQKTDYAKNICDNCFKPDDKSEFAFFIQNIIDACYWQTDSQVKKFNDQYKLNIPLTNFKQFCGIRDHSMILPDDKTTWAWKHYEFQTDKEMSAVFKCQFSTHCSRREILAYQWMNSEITLNVPEKVTSTFGLKKTDTITEWVTDSSMSHFAFEFPNFAKKYDLMIPEWYQDQAKQIITYDRMISPLSMAKCLYDNQKDEYEWLHTKFFMTDPRILDKYFSYSVVEGFFQGLSTKVKVKDLIFGFEQPALKELKERNPMIGGDPTINPLVQPMKQTETFDETRHTGNADHAMAGKFSQTNGISYVNFNKTLFNGNETYQEFVNPWGAQVEFNGGDAMFGPNLNEESIPASFQPDFFRSFRFKYLEKEDNVYGKKLETIKYVIKHEDFIANDTNKQYYQYKYNGSYNLTSIFTAPLFITKKYFLDCDDFIQDNIEIQDQGGKKIVADRSDDIMIQLQTDTGVPVKAGITIQINIEVPNDKIFAPNGEQSTLWPILTLKRNIVLSEKQIDTIFGMQMTGKNIATLVMITFIILGCLLIIFGVIFYICMTKKITQMGNERQFGDDEYLNMVDDSQPSILQQKPYKETKPTADTQKKPKATGDSNKTDESDMRNDL